MAVHWLLLVVLISTQALPLAAEDFPHDIVQSVDDVVSAIQRCYKIPSIAVALVDRRPTPPRLLTRAYGPSTNSDTASPTTLFPIGSISKSFTALAVARLLENSSYDYTTPLRDILQQRFSNNPLINSEASFGDILAHRTGLSTYGGAIMTDVDRKRLLDNIRVLPPLKKFRSSFLYNNLLYMYTGALLERLSGKGYEELIGDLFGEVFDAGSPVFFDDLNELHDTALGGYATLDEREGFSTVRYPVKEFADRQWAHVANPAGGLLLSPSDMARYIDFWLDAPSHLGAKALHELAEPQAALDSARRSRHSVSRELHGYVDEEHYYTSLGMTVGRHRGLRKLAHGGSVATFISRFTVFPDEQFGQFVSVSGPGAAEGEGATLDLEQGLLDVLVNGRLEDWSVDQLCRPLTLLDPIENAPKAIESVANAEAFVGMYENALLGSRRVTLSEEGQLRLFVGEMPVGRLTPAPEIARDIFHLHFDNVLWPDAMNAFTRKPTSLVAFERSGDRVVGMREAWAQPGEGPEVQPLYRRDGGGQSVVGFLRDLFG